MTVPCLHGNRCRRRVSRDQAAPAVAAQSGATPQTTVPRATATRVNTQCITFQQCTLNLLKMLAVLTLSLSCLSLDLLSADSPEQTNLRSLTSIVDSITAAEGAPLAYPVPVDIPK